jgi:hypothetical protein
MTANDRIILERVLAQRKKDIAPDMTESKFFELFVAEQVLKTYDLSYDELQDGLIGGGNDGGVDAIFTFVNGELLEEDTALTAAKKDVLLELQIVQATTQLGFSEDAINKLVSFSDDAFDLGKDLQKLGATYHTELIGRLERFRNAYMNLAARFPQVTVDINYASKGERPHPNVSRKVAKLKGQITKQLGGASVSFTFLGARELVDRARHQPLTTHQLEIAEGPLSSGEASYAGLIALSEFFRFLVDEQSHLRRAFFEANVRDYQGDTQVNEAIRAELGSSHAEDFWWLNNGITILATKATVSGKKLILEQPEIVNGLQTSREVYNHFTRNRTGGASNKRILVRVIVPTDPASRDRIIKATNRQNNMPDPSLRATERIHRDIEELFQGSGLYYDRRKNYYKNQGKAISSIVSIPQLAQAVMAVVLRKPDDARARPSSAFKSPEYYQRVFNDDYPIEAYLICARLMQRVQQFMGNNRSVTAAERYNLRFHLLMYVSLLIAGKTDTNIQDIKLLDISKATDSLLSRCFSRVRSIYQDLGGVDQVAKGPTFVSRIIADAERMIKADSPLRAQRRKRPMAKAI